MIRHNGERWYSRKEAAAAIGITEGQVMRRIFAISVVEKRFKIIGNPRAFISEDSLCRLLRGDEKPDYSKLDSCPDETDLAREWDSPQTTGAMSIISRVRVAKRLNVKNRSLGDTGPCFGMEELNIKDDSRFDQDWVAIIVDMMTSDDASIIKLSGSLVTVRDRYRALLNGHNKGKTGENLATQRRHEEEPGPQSREEGKDV